VNTNSAAEFGNEDPSCETEDAKILLLLFLTLGRHVPEGVLKLRYTKMGTDLSVHAVRGWQAVM